LIISGETFASGGTLHPTAQPLDQALAMAFSSLYIGPPLAMLGQIMLWFVSLLLAGPPPSFRSFRFFELLT